MFHVNNALSQHVVRCVYMMTSSNGNIFRVTGHLSLVTGEIPAEKPVTRSFDVFFDLRLNKRLRKQSWGWWFETPSRPLWRHCNALIILKSALVALTRILSLPVKLTRGPLHERCFHRSSNSIEFFSALDEMYCCDRFEIVHIIWITMEKLLEEMGPRQVRRTGD